MLLDPWLRNLGLIYRLFVFSLGDDRNREPRRPVRRQNLVSIAPVAFGKLRVVQENEFVDRSDQVKITFPWNVVRLNNGDPLRAQLRHQSVSGASIAGVFRMFRWLNSTSTNFALY